MFVPEHSTCVRSFIFKLRPPSGAVSVGVKQSERGGGPWGGVFPLRGLEARSCLSAGRLPAPKGVAPVPPAGPLFPEPSLVYTAFIPIGSCPPNRRRKGHVPARGIP